MNINKKILAGAVVTTAVVGAIGSSMFNALQADAEDSTITTAQNTSSNPPAMDQTRGGHVGKNGTKEEILTGDTAEKVKAAALSAVPGGTIDRVETDTEGAVYEAHMTKSDGTHVTVKLDGSFKVTGTEEGHGKPI